MKPDKLQNGTFVTIYLFTGEIRRGILKSIDEYGNVTAYIETNTQPMYYIETFIPSLQIKNLVNHGLWYK